MAGVRDVRLEVLDKCFRDEGRYYFLKDLIDEVNRVLHDKGMEQVSKRTIQSDIAYMKKPQGGGIVLNEHLHGGKSGREVIYRYEDTSFSINNKVKVLTGRETKQLRDTIEMLRRFKGLPNYKSLEQVLIWLKVRFHLDGMSEGTVMFAQNPYLKGLDLFEELLEAVMGKQRIDIMYAPYGRKKKIRQVHPYQLRQWNYRWYLIGLEERLRSRIPYAVIPIDRIEYIDRVYSDGFIPKGDDDFDFDEYFKNIVGVSLQGKDEGKVKPRPVAVRAKVTYPNAWYMDTKPIHASQRVLKSTEPWIKGEEGEKPKHGYMVFQWNVIPNEEFVQALMVYADQVEVVDPEALSAEDAGNTEKEEEYKREKEAAEWVRLKLIDRAKAILVKNGIR